MARTAVSFIIVPNEYFPKIVKEGEGGDERMPHIEIFSAISFLKNKLDGIDIRYINFPILFSGKSSISVFLRRLNHAEMALKIQELMFKFIIKSDCYIMYIPLWSENLGPSVKLAQRLRKSCPNSKMVLMGPCCKLYPKEILEKFNIVDFIITSEPEHALLKIITGTAVENIPNIAHRKGDTICTHKEKPLNLWDIKHGLDYSTHLSFLRKYKFTFPDFLYFETSRGCKYNCFFCSLLTARKLRFKKIGFVIKELGKIVKDTGIRNFYFVDNELNFDNKYLETLMDKIISARMNIRWSSYMVAKGLNERVLSKMHHAGCIHIRWGIETANPSRQRIISKRLDLNEVATILKAARISGIRNQVAFTVGYPYECQLDVDLTTKFLENNRENLDCVNVYKFKPRRNSIAFRNPGAFGIEILLTQDKFWKDDMPFRETKGLDWHLKKGQQAYYAKILEERIEALDLKNIDPEIYFKGLL